MKKLFGMLCLAVLFAATGEARGGFINFDADTVNTGMVSSWQYVYDTALVDVQLNSFYFAWDTGYNDLTNVMYGPTSLNNYDPLLIDFLALTSGGVTLNSFNLGNYNGEADASGTQYKVIDLADNSVLYDSGLFTVAFPGPAPLFSPNLSSTVGIRLEILADSNGKIAIDNIAFSGSAVPEPATIVIWGIGAFGMGLVARRRKKQTV
jgi:hypothetical protein